MKHKELQKAPCPVARKRMVCGIFFTVIVIGLIWLYWGNVSIQTTRYEISDMQIPSDFDGFVIVHVSDLHNAEFGKHQQKLINAIEKANPDMIAVTGDLIDSRHTNVDAAMEFIERAVEIAPVYYVTGNHEARTEEYSRLQTELLEAGVIILENSIQKIEYKEQFIYLIGLEDPNFAMLSADEVSQKLDILMKQAKGYTILLSHRPELFDTYCDAGANLVLSGHAHGGQIRLPIIGGVAAPNQGFFPKYSEGCIENENTKMIVSRGLGNSIIPVRVNNRPELVVITLESN